MGEPLRRVPYNAWANARALEMLATLAEPYQTRPLLLLSHILRAERVWLNRIGEVRAALAVWETDTLEACRERIEENTAALTALVPHSTTDTLHVIAYTDTKGTPHETALGDILEHVFNHGTHHRGQIALLVREAGEVPLPLDFIAFVRERQ